MKIIITFDTANAAFQDFDFDSEVKNILKQAEDYLLHNRDSYKLIDSNGNIVGNVFRSTAIRRG